jgi:SAM-dependent methyltransferase
MQIEPDFGNWIRLRKVATILLVSAAVVAIAAPLPAPWYWLLLVPGGCGLLTGLFLLYVHHQFRDTGGGLQRQLWALTLEHLGAAGTLSGTALDIGTGNGSLAITAARENPALQVTGIDLWSSDWAYSIETCCSNAERAGVESRAGFRRASADALPFADATFDYVMSHFVFHEVACAADKRSLVIEALRVLKPRGYFSFHDMFFDVALYGDSADLIASLQREGLHDVELVDSRPLVHAPRALMSKRILGHCAILRGQK